MWEQAPAVLKAAITDKSRGGDGTGVHHSSPPRCLDATDGTSLLLVRIRKALVAAVATGIVIVLSNAPAASTSVGDIRAYVSARATTVAPAIRWARGRLSTAATGAFTWMLAATAWIVAATSGAATATLAWLVPAASAADVLIAQPVVRSIGASTAAPDEAAREQQTRPDEQGPQSQQQPEEQGRPHGRQRRRQQQRQQRQQEQNQEGGAKPGVLPYPTIPSAPETPTPASSTAVGRAAGGDATSALGGCCPVCLDNGRNVALVPCGHTLCRECAARVRPCPVCRSPIASILTLY